MSPQIRRHAVWLCLALAAAGPTPAQPVPYTLDQRYATIAFSTSGLLGIQGYFQSFAGHLKLDFQTPENSSIDVTVDDRVMSLSWQPDADILRSRGYFNSKVFPQILFHSIAVKPTGRPNQFEILGALTIRGVTRPQMMLATLLSKPASGTADFYVTGTLLRSAFGMVADQAEMSDKVVLQIHARVMLEKSK